MCAISRMKKNNGVMHMEQMHGIPSVGKNNDVGAYRVNVCNPCRERKHGFWAYRVNACLALPREMTCLRHAEKLFATFTLSKYVLCVISNKSMSFLPGENPLKKEKRVQGI